MSDEINAQFDLKEHLVRQTEENSADTDTKITKFGISFNMMEPTFFAHQKHQLVRKNILKIQEKKAAEKKEAEEKEQLKQIEVKKLLFKQIQKMNFG